MCGSYDMVCNYYENVWTVANLDPDLARRITVRTYEGGHEAYLGKAPRREMQRDLTAFITQTLNANSRR
jgi:hypothetical protein